MAVTYKQIGSECKYTVSPLVSGIGEVLTLSRSKKRESVQSGLLIDSDIPYQLGSVVQLDIQFPGQEHTYRSKGIVSWTEQSPVGENFQLGITITGMDKLDKYGNSMALAEAMERHEPNAPSLESLEELDDEQMHPYSVPPPAELKSQQPTSLFEDDESLIAQAAGPLEISSDNKTVVGHPNNALGPEDFMADTIPPPASAKQGLRIGDLINANHQNKPEPPRVDIPTIHGLFAALSMLLPEENFGERVFIDEVFVLPEEPLSSIVSEIIASPGKRADFFIRIEQRNAGKLCALLPAGGEAAPPSAYVMEQTLLMYTGMDVQVIRMRDSQMSANEISCVAKLAAASTTVRALLGVDDELLQNLIRYKDGPVLPENLLLDERTSRVSLVVSQDNNNYRKSIPIEACISAMPPKVAGPQSVKMDQLVVEAFESMEHLYGADNHDEAARFALSLSRRLIRCEAAICTLMAPGKTELYIAATDGAIPETRLGARLSLSDGLIGFCMRTGKVARTDKPDEIKESLLRETGLAVHSIVCAPISNEEHTMGTIELINSTSNSGFTREKADLLAYIAKSLGEFIANSLPEQKQNKSK